MRAKKNRVLRGFQEFHKGFRRGSMKGYHHGLCAMKVPFRLGLQWVHEVGFVVVVRRAFFGFWSWCRIY